MSCSSAGTTACAVRPRSACSASAPISTSGRAGTAPDALARVNARMLEWADLIFIMDDQQRRSLKRRFGSHPALEHLICLDIPDDFAFMQPELIGLLQDRLKQHLPIAHPKSLIPDP